MSRRIKIPDLDEVSISSEYASSYIRVDLDALTAYVQHAIEKNPEKAALVLSKGIPLKQLYVIVSDCIGGPKATQPEEEAANTVSDWIYSYYYYGWHNKNGFKSEELWEDVNEAVTLLSQVIEELPGCMTGRVSDESQIPEDSAALLRLMDKHRDWFFSDDTLCDDELPDGDTGFIITLMWLQEEPK